MRALKNRSTIVVAGILFLVSFALPAYDGRSGLECAMASADAIFSVTLNHEQFSSAKELLFTLYIGLFNITNIFTVFLLFKNSIYPEKRLHFMIRAYYVVVIICTASWWLISFASGDLSALDLGYYLWLVSITLLGIYNWIPAKTKSKAAQNATS